MSTKTNSMRFAHRYLSRLREQDSCNFFLNEGKIVEKLRNEPIVFFGEIHSEPRVVECLRTVLRAMTTNSGGNSGSSSNNNDENCTCNKLHIVMEHFSFEMQTLLDQHLNHTKNKSEMRRELNFIEFCKEYRAFDTENHDLSPYEDFFNDIVALGPDRVKVHGGFVPRPLASRLYQSYKHDKYEERKHVFEEIWEKDYLPKPTSSESVGQQHVFYDDRNSDYTSPILSSTYSHQLFFSSLMGAEIDFDYVHSLNHPDNFDEYKEAQRDGLETVGKGGMFQAQVLKDQCMGYYLAKLIKQLQIKRDDIKAQESTSSPSFLARDQILVVLGKGHCGFKTGAFDMTIKAMNTLLCPMNNVYGHPISLCNVMAYELDLDDDDDVLDNNAFDKKILEVASPMMQLSDDNYKQSVMEPYADLLFIYDEDDDRNNNVDEFGRIIAESNVNDDDNHIDDAKAETRKAYNSVGESMLDIYETKLFDDTNRDITNVDKIIGKRDLPLAIATTRYLGYTDAHLKAQHALELVNFQGVGCPFDFLDKKSNNKQITNDSKVLDLGCGLGFDSMLCLKYYGANSVYGIDLSKKQIEWCEKRISQQGLNKDNVQFYEGDIENLIQSGSSVLKSQIGTFSHVISNGAFCLLPNKRKGFETAHAALKPGGVMAICCTVVKDTNSDNPLLVGSSDNHEESKTHFPVCMKMFSGLSELEPILKDIGFSNITLDLENSLMEYELCYDDSLVEEVFPGETKQSLFADIHSDGSDIYRIHGKSDEEKQFSHLSRYNMNDLCCRVTIFAEK